MLENNTVLPSNELMTVDSIFISKELKGNSTLQFINELRSNGSISDADYHLACYYANEVRLLDTATFNLIVLLALRCSYELNQQNTCFLLTQLTWVDWLMHHNVLLPEHNEWAERLQSTDLLGEDAPFVLDNGLVYFSRYHNMELAVAEFVITGQTRKPAHHWLPAELLDGQSEIVDGLFQSTSSEADKLDEQLKTEIDWQYRAVLNSLSHQFSVITGGPGTGKTTTVIKLLSSLVQYYLEQPTLIQKQIGQFTIKLAAPTGKAALRLTESMLSGIDKLSISDDIRAYIPTEASTIHRLLKSRGRNDFYYNSNNKLPIDVLVLDEASMVDLSLMSKLMSALPSRCQLVLIGDKEQLASVEAGNLLAEICAPLQSIGIEQQDALQPVTELKKSYRFDSNGEIGLLAKAVNKGVGKAVEHLLIENCLGADDANRQRYLESGSVLTWLDPNSHSIKLIVERVVRHQVSILDRISEITESNEFNVVKALFNKLYELQVLSCVRQSIYGVEEFNKLVKERLSQLGRVAWQDEHYAGRPILVTENAYHLGLYNGDIGIQIPDPVSDQLVTYFIDGKGDMIKLFNQRLPAHESVYAMTVHKSQGSEFDHTILIMPGDDVGVKLLGRELIYTAITRAKTRFTIFGDKDRTIRAVNNHTVRQSGLSKLLYGL